MLLDNKKNKAIKSHLKIYKTYKELKNILPFGYIKTRICPGQKYSFKKQSILINLEKEKNKEISPKKITKNLLTNKNIYIFSEENDNTKKIISKLKKYYSYNKSHKIMNNESNITSENQNSSSQISRNKSNLNNYIMNANTINYKKNSNNYYVSALSENEKSKNDIKDSNMINNEYEFDLFKNNKMCYRSSSIKNYVMKNNIYLPSITNRLKNNLPRYQREINGLLVNGLGKRSMKELNININNNNEKLLLKSVDNKNNFNKFLKTKSGPVYIQSYDIKNDNIFNENIINRLKKHKTHLYKKYINIDDSVEILGIKKLDKKE